MTSQQLNIIENEIALRAYLEQARELINKPLGQLLLSEGLITQRALDDAMM